MLTGIEAGIDRFLAVDPNEDKGTDSQQIGIEEEGDDLKCGNSRT